MTEYLTLGIHEYALRPWSGSESARRFVDEADAEAFLRPFTADPANVEELRRIAGPLPPTELTRSVALRLARGELEVVPREGEERAILAAEEKVEEKATPQTRERAWISFRFVHDETGDPIPHLQLRVTLPDGSAQETKTDSDGTAEFKEIDEGSCSVTSPLGGSVWDRTFEFRSLGREEDSNRSPQAREEDKTCPCHFCAFPVSDVEKTEEETTEPPAENVRITRVKVYRLQKEETLEQAAQANTTSWDNLALFNWGTTNREKVKREFESSGGTLLIATEWKEEKLETNRTHVIRVAPCEKREHRLAVRVVDEEGKPVSGLPCRCEEESVDLQTDDDGRFVYGGVAPKYHNLRIRERLFHIPALPRTVEGPYTLHLVKETPPGPEIAGDAEAHLRSLAPLPELRMDGEEAVA